MFAIPALGRQREEDGKFQARLGYIVRCCINVSPPKEMLGEVNSSVTAFLKLPKILPGSWG
jgi:hypothetical protein